MEFKLALLEIQKKYKLRQITKDVYEVVINQNLNNFNKSFLAIKDCKKAILTDYGKTSELVSCEEDVLKSICKANHVNFNNFVIECPFHSIQDVDNMLNCFKQIMQANNK